MGEEFQSLYGNIDIYWFDQLLKGRVRPGSSILDAGCGQGRNLHFLVGRHFDVHGVDQDPRAIEHLRRSYRRARPAADASEAEGRFRVGDIAALPWPEATFDVVLSCAVLHFASDVANFDQMLGELWRVLRGEGMLFVRLASKIGIEDRLVSRGEQRFELPDGSERFLVDEEFLLERAERLQARQLDPIKTTNVQGLRCMTTWVLEKPPAGS
ncbi:MAG: class I SAM-dependent methyltransferase [Thermoanaerobaculia bacterium]|nr:class I SAM-dependent methyltransferase [Thermoanaerobaculia bacterium]